jgi:hypothetical protein
MLMNLRNQLRRLWGKVFPALAFVAAVAVLGGSPSEAARAPAEGNLPEVAERTAPPPGHPDAGGGGRVMDRTRLGIDKERFTLDGRPTFLLGISYYGGLGADLETLRKDLDAMKSHGFNWIRLWATWSYAGEDVSAVDIQGRPREPYLSRLKTLVTECDRRGIVVDVTLSRGRAAIGGGIPDMAGHRTAVRSIIDALKARTNWYLDLANERDVRDARYVSTEEIRELRDLARRLAPALPVTASFGGHDLGEEYLRKALIDADLDFVAPHRPRVAGSPAQTQQHTRECLDAMRKLGRLAPVHYQEPFRRGYGHWQPVAEDYLTDLRGAVEGGAAGWCLHNGSRRDAQDDRPRRCFDLRAQSLMEQLDHEEMAVISQAGRIVEKARSS